jgi:uncharacterized RDD family membrane protein YckC
MQAHDVGSTVTPEAVRLRADLAGIGSRSIALILDLLIQSVVLVPVLLVLLTNGIGGIGEAIAISVLLFIVLWLYFPAFELLRNGQTPGKRWQGIRVVRTDGQPAGLAAVAVRNLIRIVEVTLLPFIALIAMVATPRSQRLGDLAAGTMVVRDRSLPAPHVVALHSPGNPSSVALDTSRMTAHDYTVLRTFLSRRPTLDPTARERLAARLAARVREQLGERPGSIPLTDEQLIDEAARSYRARFTDRSG